VRGGWKARGHRLSHQMKMPRLTDAQLGREAETELWQSAHTPFSGRCMRALSRMRCASFSCMDTPLVWPALREAEGAGGSQCCEAEEAEPQNRASACSLRSLARSASCSLCRSSSGMSSSMAATASDLDTKAEGQVEWGPERSAPRHPLDSSQLASTARSRPVPCSQGQCVGRC
jgi:hypothetical protein